MASNAGGDRMVDEPISGEQADTPMGGGPPWATDAPAVGAFANDRVAAGVVLGTVVPPTQGSRTADIFMNSR
jgi:hypothetical protein